MLAHPCRNILHKYNDIVSFVTICMVKKFCHSCLYVCIHCKAMVIPGYFSQTHNNFFFTLSFVLRTHQGKKAAEKRDWYISLFSSQRFLDLFLNFDYKFGQKPRGRAWSCSYNMQTTCMYEAIYSWFFKIKDIFKESKIVLFAKYPHHIEGEKKTTRWSYLLLRCEIHLS